MREIVEDTRQQEGKHGSKHEWWRAHGVVFKERSRALPFGDYMSNGSNICIDTKRDLAELTQNLGKDHKRFIREMERAREAGYRLVILVETREAENVGDLCRWVNPVCRRCDLRITQHCHPLQSGICDFYGNRGRPLQGARMAKMMQTIEDRYGARFEFCDPVMSARRICELLGVEWDD